MLNEKISFSKYDINSIDNKYFEEAKRLLPDDKYIGFSITQGNEYRKKSWSIENFINLSNELYKKNKKSVYFIEKTNLELINKIKNEVKGALFPEHNSNLTGPPLVTALSTRLEKAISIDNGIMHMIGLANIPMIVLFGPTNSKKFAPKVDDIEILDSKEIYTSSDILKITEKDVLDLI
jgi:ADP-heptose:LPS heptosyltransferase